MERRYSGPGRSGICVCGHGWEQHHLCLVMNKEYIEATGEGYIVCECEAYGFNEAGGLQCVDGWWVEHCSGYRDSLTT